jgi:DNA repair exonuclease SbcCD ATPase subunit
MIKFKSVSSKNFLTVGDNPITILLDRAQTTAITGKNGVGKSSLTSESVSFALFGKSFRGINKSELINTTNRKAALVVVEFDIGSTPYKVSRGIKPDVFTIEKSGQLLPEVSASEMQATLDGILGFDHAMFCSSIALGYANYTPFMEMTKAQRRQFVEDALGLSVFADMNKIIKSQLSAHNASMTEINTKIAKTESYIEATESSNEYIKQTIDKELANINTDIEKILESVKEQKATLTGLVEQIDSFSIDQTFTNSLRAEIVKVQADKSYSERERNTVLKTLEFYKANSTCPTCKTEMTEAHRKDHIDTAKVTITSLDSVIKEAEETLESLTEKLKENVQNITTVTGLEAEAQRVKAKITHEVSRAKFLKAEAVKRKEFSTTTIDTTEQKELLKRLSSDLDAALVRQEEFKIAVDLLKDSGIKASVVENFLPTLNAKINQLLETIGFGVRIQFDSEFQESLIGRYADEFSYKSLSQGERERMNLAIIFAWNALMGRDGANTSLLILDEIGMSALDADGVQSLFRLVDTEYSDKNVFVISHNPEVVHQCKSHIKFTKKDGFARIVE